MLVGILCKWSDFLRHSPRLRMRIFPNNACHFIRLVVTMQRGFWQIFSRFKIWEWEVILFPHFIFENLQILIEMTIKCFAWKTTSHSQSGWDEIKCSIKTYCLKWHNSLFYNHFIESINKQTNKQLYWNIFFFFFKLWCNMVLHIKRWAQ